MVRFLFFEKIMVGLRWGNFHKNVHPGTLVVETVVVAKNVSLASS
jgi:hypothetical protein